MANVLDIARYILETKGETSAMKLHRLCYYSQAWALAWTGKPLFEEDFQAWGNGPVCPELFAAHEGELVISELPNSYESEPLTDDEMDTINCVRDYYGEFEPYHLREQVQSEEPWINARGNTPEGERSTVIISKDSIGEYYRSL